MSAATHPVFGRMLRDYRQAARLSQLELGLRANVSARHISFIETGRARPSREMVTLLASTLDVPLRDRNLLLTAAGFAERFRESDLNDDEIADVRRALELMLKKQEPWPSMVFDARWNLLIANAAAQRVMGWLLAGQSAPPPGGSYLELLLSDALADVIENWSEVVAHSVARIRREVAAGTAHPDVVAYLDRISTEPAVQRAVAEPRRGDSRRAVAPGHVQPGR